MTREIPKQNKFIEEITSMKRFTFREAMLIGELLGIKSAEAVLGRLVGRGVVRRVEKGIYEADAVAHCMPTKRRKSPIAKPTFQPAAAPQPFSSPTPLNIADLLIKLNELVSTIEYLIGLEVENERLKKDYNDLNEWVGRTLAKKPMMRQ